MKTATASILLALGSLSWISAGALTPYHKAVEQAVKDKKYMVVVWNGSDWSDKARMVTGDFERFSEKQALPVIWCEWDERNNVTEEEKNSDFFKKQKPPATVWDIPAILVLSPDNKLLYKAEGVKSSQIPQIASRIPALINLNEKATQFWKDAEQAKGEKAATLYGKGLALLPANVTSERRDILDKVRKADPEDEAGVMLVSSFNHQPIMEKINRMCRDNKDYEGAAKLINQKLAVKGLTNEERQMLMAGRFAIARNRQDKPQMIKELIAIVKVAPKSDMGRGATYYYNYLTKPVLMKGNKFTGREMRPDFMPLVMDASPYIKSPGTYKVECRVEQGGCDFRNPRIMSGRKIIADTPASIKDKNARSFTIEVPSSPSATQLVLDVKGSGWFSAMGEIVITKQ